MILTLATRYRKEIAFFILYSFFLSGACSVLYAAGNNYSLPVYSLKGPVTTDHLPQQFDIMSSALAPVNRSGNLFDTISSNLVKGPAIVHAGNDKVNIGGPSQPEMGAFKPVGADNMVDPFTGDFSYNIPLLDVGGYPVNIFYNSGITMDQEASWVGLGWNINPGTISRNMRGLPDDFNGTEKMIQERYSRPDKTWGVTLSGSTEFSGMFGLGLNYGMFKNNIRGIGMEFGVRPSISIGGYTGDTKTSSLSFGWQLSGNSQTGGSSTFSISLSENNKIGLDGSLSASLGFQSRQGMQALRLDAEVKKLLTSTKSQEAIRNKGVGISAPLSTSINFAYPSFMPSMRNKTTFSNYDVDIGLGTSFAPAFPNARAGGYYTEQRIREEDITIEQPAYGMLYLKQGQENTNALMDFNRLNDGVYNKNTPAISVPVYTYDVFSITGEGTGGSFRAYRGDLGYMKDAIVKNDGNSQSFGFEAGTGSGLHGGVNLRTVLTPSESGDWVKSNPARNSFLFKESNKDTQTVYFKNPGEKAIPNIAYQNSIGDEDLVRLKLVKSAPGSSITAASFIKYSDALQLKGELPVSNSAAVKHRDKRTQVISFLTAKEAEEIGLNKKIRYINEASAADETKVLFGCADNNYKKMDRSDQVVRRGHHISEMDVLMADGRRYVYDIPVYNLSQKEVTFNLTGSGNGTGPNAPLQPYTDGTDNAPQQNKNGKDHFVETQVTPPYAHSYLLTALLSPNYVDVKGDGITEDDMGDAIKFNYMKGKDQKWRTPADAGKATLSEGLKTDKNDDKGHYIYGEREQWYLYSVESKNMVARFYVKEDRKDSRSVKDENGGIDNSNGAYKLSKICLFTKGELLKRPDNPRPVKTVHFVYDYSLCPNINHNSGVAEWENGINKNAAKGKLTLKEIYFTYNGNNRGKRNVYRFYYPADAAGNPSYSFMANDRWGNYKPATTDNENPGGLNNADYPYTTANAVKSDEYAKAWTLNKIKLPSGATMEMTYEADDYAFVQNRRASRMLTISGFGTSESPSAYSGNLYESSGSSNDYIYITVPKAITATTQVSVREQIQQWYLGDFVKSKQVYMKIAVNMPSDKQGSGYELVPVYAEIEDVGLIPNTNGQKIWLKVKKLASGYTPMLHYSLQYLKSNLPSKAYKGYDVAEETDFKQMALALAAMFSSMKEVFEGGMKMLISDRACKTTDLSRSFIRLSDPYLKKPGGGLRVKKVVINDNWDKMTHKNNAPGLNNGMANATYGQEYFYTKKEMINGDLLTVSSGVASWEPALGAEENPHRKGIEYYIKNKKADYDYAIMETPIPEMLYPSASVGYSRVEIRSIHRDTVKNAPGISVTEFYTSREFPTSSSFTPLSENGAKDLYQSGALDKMLKANLKTSATLSQGFKVELNDMNGKMKKQSTYSPQNLNDPISYTENFYSKVPSGSSTFKLNHNFPVITGPDGNVQQSIIGREIELMTDFREHRKQTITTNLDLNFDAPLPFYIPIPGIWKPLVREENIYRSVSMLKIVNHYAVLDSVVAVDKGSMVSTKNLVYDAETGEPLLTRTNNEHNKPIYSFSYPAHWAYSGMGLAYKNIDVIFRNVTFRNGLLEPGPAVDFSLFESGDEIYVDASNAGWKPVPANQPCDNLPLLYTPAKKIWAINTEKVKSLTPQWIFIDADGKPFTAKDVNIRIVRSGKRNIFGASLGSVASLGNPWNTQTSKIELSDAAKIIQTAAATYKDHWRVDDVLFKKDSVVTVNTPVTVQSAYYPLYRSVDMGYSIKRKEKGDPNISTSIIYNPESALAGYVDGDNNNHFNDAWLDFNMAASPLPAGARVYKAFLTLYGHTGANISYPPSTFTHTFPKGKFSHDHLRPHANLGSPGNSVSIMRMKTDWPANELSWRNVMEDKNKTLHDWAKIGWIPPTTPGEKSEGDRMLNFNRDNRVDVTSLVKDMLGDAGQGQPLRSIIRMMMTRNSGVMQGNTPWTVALQNDKAVDQCYLGMAPLQKPRLKVFYYMCEGNAIIVDPPTGGGIENKADPYNGAMITCQQQQLFSFCLSKFSQQKSINPYVEGIWGNWRADTSFVYYGNRAENTVIDGQPVDTRTGGTISGYKSFWNFASLATGLLVRNYAAADVWTWNSAITQYNRKGYEIENKDPLGRFNAGLYGYNQQLPVAVINNSRQAESLFDGFEDYAYQSNSCTEICPPRKRVNMGNITALLSTEQKHSGKQSLKLAAGQTYSFSAPVVTAASLDRAYGMRVRVDSTSYTTTKIIPKGTGFRGKYYDLPKNNPTCSQTKANADNAINYGTPTAIRQEEQIDFPFNQFPLPPGVGRDYFAVHWEGYVQPVVTAKYSFLVAGDDCFKLSITVNGVERVLFEQNQCGISTKTSDSDLVDLVAGQTYKISLRYFNQNINMMARLQWRRYQPNYVSTSPWTNWEPIPKSQVYSPDNLADVNGSVVTVTNWCTKADYANVWGNALTDTFSLIQGRKMVMGAWVKVGGNDCKCSTYTNNKIRISYAGNSTTAGFVPAGSIIEGWQRYEAVFTVPATATGINVALINESGSPAWFDDLRIHPFNANMKSFVYDPQNLRLMSELDENNYASFYEYDDEGTLIRAKKETIKGVKTITETRSHLQKSVD